MQTPEIKDTESFEKFKEWLNNNGKSKIALIHDVDGDGISSGKILIEGLRKLDIKVQYRFAGFDRNEVFNDFITDFTDRNNVDTIIITDISLFATNFMDKQNELENKKIIVFDHHEKPEDVPKNVIYFHPTLTFNFDNPSQYCASKLIYDILNKLTDLSELNWVASIGIVADMNYKTWKKFVDQTLQSLNLPVPDSPFDSELQRVGTLLYYALAMEKEDSQKAIKIYFAAHSYQEALTELQSYSVVEEEVNRLTDNWEQNSEKFGAVIFVRIDSKYKINSMVSSKISFQFPNKTFLFYSPAKTHPDKIGFSLRRQDGKINLPKILHQMEKQIPEMSGGGHIQASGAKCNLKDLEKFKKLFVRLHKELEK